MIRRALFCWCLFVAVRGGAVEGVPVFNVRAYGAAGDGRQLDTAALNRAIDACARQGGGRVYVPPGRYLTGTVVLQSHVTLEIEGGATLLGSENPEDYVVSGEPRGRISPLIYAADAENITLTGRGAIDGQGAVWWQRERFNAGAGPQTPEEKAEVAKIARGRPFLVHPVRCKDLVIEQVTLRNSAFWTLNPVDCENVRIAGVTVYAEKGSVNTDGINPQSCTNVQILSCRVDTGDDGICLKSGEQMRSTNRPIENVTIANCIVERAHGGVVLGAGLAGGARNVVVTNCVFRGTDVGIRIKSRRDRCGVVEAVNVSNLVMEDVPVPFVITMFYTNIEQPWQEYPIGPGTPRYRDFHFSHITARGAETAGMIIGRRERPIEQITFTDVHIQAASAFTCTNARDIAFIDSFIDTESGPALVLANSSNIQSARLATRQPHPGVQLIGSTTLEEKAAAARAAPPVGAKVSLPTPAGARVIADLGLTLIRVPAGKFVLGSPFAEHGRDRDESPQTEVTVSRDFWIGQYEVTQRAWSALMERNRSRQKGDDLPVTNVSWEEAREFCRRLTARERTAGRLPTDYAYALPSEVQWEFAARPGAAETYPDRLDVVAWHSRNSGGITHPVGQKQPNGRGLFDVQGNVWEWCLDVKSDYPGGSVTDYVAPGDGLVRACRGGAAGNWFFPYQCRPAYRHALPAGVREPFVGFRLALSPPTPPSVSPVRSP